MKLFEALGGWVATVPELDIKMRLGTHCYHHAWHAELWHKRLPELREMKPERLTVPANDAMADFITAMTEPEGPELTIEKLVGVYRVLIPRFVAAYTYHMNNTSEITDAPTIRSLKFALQDEIDDWRDGELMLQSLITTPDHVARRVGPPGRARSDHGRSRRHHRPRLHRADVLIVAARPSAPAGTGAAGCDAMLLRWRSVAGSSDCRCPPVRYCWNGCRE